MELATAGVVWLLGFREASQRRVRSGRRSAVCLEFAGLFAEIATSYHDVLASQTGVLRRIPGASLAALT
jgi:hypothetical protein